MEAISYTFYFSGEKIATYAQLSYTVKYYEIANWLKKFVLTELSKRTGGSTINFKTQ